MSLPRFRFKIAGFFMVISLAMGLTYTPQAMAQSNQQKAERAREAAQAEALKTVTKLITQSGLPCEVVEASTLGQAEAIIDGKTVKVITHEVACKSLKGYILAENKDKLISDPMSCNQAQTLNKKDAATPVCKLKANRVIHYWLGDIAKSKIPTCAISGARWISPDATKEKELYEIGCKGAAGGIFTVPTYKAKDQSVGFLNCLKVENTPLQCQNTTHEVAALYLAPQVKKHKGECAIFDARFVGAAKDSEYYEVGCKDRAGFIMVTDLNAQYQSSVGCDKAEKIGGCKFTDMAALQQTQKVALDAQKTVLVAALTKGGITCTVESFAKRGYQSDTKRDIAEFKCTEMPLGLVAIIPIEGSTAALETYDCFAAKMLQLPCNFVTDADLLTHIKTLSAGHKSIRQDCVIDTARYAFVGSKGEIVMEIACANKVGYITVLNKARTVLSPVVPCHIAATNPNVPEKCTIAGNGSNKGA